MRDAAAWLVSGLSGSALWIFANYRQGTQEPWDGPDYWTTYLPLALVLTLILGVLFPEKTWRWSLAVMFAQWPVMMLGTGKLGGPLMGVGLGLMAVLTLLGNIPAALGARLRNWAEHKASA